MKLTVDETHFILHVMDEYVEKNEERTYNDKERSEQLAKQIAWARGIKQRAIDTLFPKEEDELFVP